jgi:hypothetical protein
MAVTQYVKYNDFDAPFDTLTYTVTPEYSESGTLIAHRYEFTIKGWLAADTDKPERSLVNTINNMRRRWQQPRGALLIYWTPTDTGTQEIMFQFGNASKELIDPDYEYGPLPTSVEIVDIAGGLACQYTFKIAASTRENWNVGESNPVRDNAYITSNPIIFLTREFKFGIDQNALTTRTVSGKYKVVANVLGESKGPGSFRQYVIPPIPKGFVRSDQQFTVEADQLTATFSITDKEVGQTLPEDMTTGDATVSCVQTNRSGFAEFTLSGWFAAPKTVSKQQILARIGTLADSRGMTERGCIVTKREISTSLYIGNRIDFTFNWKRPKINKFGLFQAATNGLTPLVKTPPSAANPTIAGPYGTANLREYILQLPYNPAKTPLASLSQILAQSGGNLVPVATFQNAARPPAFNSAPPSDVSPENEATPFLEFIHVRSIQVDNGLVVMPPLGRGAPIIQQAHAPVVHVIDSGVLRVAAKSWAEVPKIPGPPPGYKVIKFSPVPEAPTPIGDGNYSEYCIRWTCLSVYDSKVQNNAMTGLEVLPPVDPRRTSSAGQDSKSAWNRVPDGMIIPPPKAT